METFAHKDGASLANEALLNALAANGSDYSMQFLPMSMNRFSTEHEDQASTSSGLGGVMEPSHTNYYQPSHPHSLNVPDGMPNPPFPPPSFPGASSIVYDEELRTYKAVVPRSVFESDISQSLLSPSRASSFPIPLTTRLHLSAPIPSYVPRTANADVTAGADLLAGSRVPSVPYTYIADDRFQLRILVGPQPQIYRDARTRIVFKLEPVPPFTEQSLNNITFLQIAAELENDRGIPIRHISQGALGGQNILSANVFEVTVNAADHTCEISNLRVREISRHHQGTFFQVAFRLLDYPHVPPVVTSPFFVKSERVRAPSYATQSANTQRKRKERKQAEMESSRGDGGSGSMPDMTATSQLSSSLPSLSGISTPPPPSALSGNTNFIAQQRNPPPLITSSYHAPAASTFTEISVGKRPKIIPDLPLPLSGLFSSTTNGSTAAADLLTTTTTTSSQQQPQQPSETISGVSYSSQSSFSNSGGGSGVKGHDADAFDALMLLSARKSTSIRTDE